MQLHTRQQSSAMTVQRYKSEKANGEYIVYKSFCKTLFGPAEHLPVLHVLLRTTDMC